MTVTVDPDGGTVVDVIVDAPGTVDVILPPPITLIDLGNIGGPAGPPGPQGEPGPPGEPGTDYDPADADTRYVNVTGDEMSGMLYLRSGPTPHTPQAELVGDYPFLRFHQPNVTFAGIALRPGAGLQMTTGHDMNALAPLRIGSPVNGDDAARVDWVQQSIAASVPTMPPETDGGNNTHYGLNSGMYGAGSANSGLGQQALQVIFGSNNVGVGYNAGKEINQGNHNVAVGFGALYAAGGNAANMTFNQNLHVGVGYASGAYAPGTGDAIVAVGGFAMAHTQATAIGYDAQAQGAFSTAIGVGSRATADHQIVLGTAAENVAIPGTLTVNGVPITSILDRLAALEARLTELEN